MIGRSVERGARAQFDNGDDPVATVLEWGVRALDKPVERQRGARPRRAREGGMFPAYDDDGGLLVVLTPAK